MVQSYIFFLLATLFMFGCEKEETKLKRVEVILGGEIKELKGIKWPKTDDGAYHSCLSIPENCLITIHFTKQKSFTTFSRTVFLDRKNEIITYVSVVPTKKTLPFQEAVKQVATISKELGVEDAPLIKERLNEWKNLSPIEKSGFPLPTRAMFLDRINVRFELNYNEDFKGWYLITQFNLAK